MGIRPVAPTGGSVELSVTVLGLSIYNCENGLVPGCQISYGSRGVDKISSHIYRFRLCDVFGQSFNSNHIVRKYCVNGCNESMMAAAQF